MLDYKTADILDRAAQIIEIRGWTQGAAMNEQGNVCSVGAMDLVQDEGSCTFSELVKAIADFGQYMFDCDGSVASAKIAKWNDEYHRTQEDVVTAMRTCATLTRNGLDGPSRTIIVTPDDEPLTVPQTWPDPIPQEDDPVYEPVPEENPDLVPA